MLSVCSYKKLPVDVQPGSQILCADGSIVLEVLKCNPDQGTVRCRCTNNATLGYVARSIASFLSVLVACFLLLPVIWNSVNFIGCFVGSSIAMAQTARQCSSRLSEIVTICSKGFEGAGEHKTNRYGI